MARKKLYAAIDVGSHEIQMKIAELSREEAPRVIEHVRRTLPLGTATYQKGELTPSLLQTCTDVLRGLALKLKEYRIGEVSVLATSAFREAVNQTYAIDQIASQSGLDIRILSNSEERYYHTLAIMAGVPDFDHLIEQGTLLVDLSAGSIQLTVYHKGEFVLSQNLRLGSLRIRDLLAHLERRTADLPTLMDEYISIDLATYHLHELKGIVYQNLIITGHELSYLKKLAGLEPDSLAFMSEKKFNAVYQELLHQDPSVLAMERNIPTEHASLLLPAAIIIRRMLSYTGLKRMILPTAGLSDGVLIAMACKHKGYRLPYDQSRDIISASRHLSRRFRTDRHHNEAVEQAALTLFDETERLHRLKARDRLLLQIAVILRDCGKYINISLHHERSYNIILASELIGLTPVEQRIVAWTARLHGGMLMAEPSEYKQLPVEDQLRIAKLSALLRLADAIDMGHRQKVQAMSVDWDGRTMLLQLSAMDDMTLELWTIEQRLDFFNKVFGTDIRVKIRRLMA